MNLQHLLTFFLSLVVSVALQAQAIHVVNTVSDIDDGVCNSAHCSLREAINASNTNMGPDSIEFNIPGAGPHMINLANALPGILDSFLVIDGTTQPGNNPMASQIVVDGSGLAPGPNHGLVIYTRRTEIYGLRIQNFPADGIQMFGGFVDDPFLSGIIIGAPGKGNVIVSNGSYGIEGPVDRNITIRGNYVGTDLQFNPGLGNAWDGIFLNVLSGQNVRVGGQTSLNQQNYLCSNMFSGLRISISDPAQFSIGFTITGNIIGTDVSGTANLGNQGFTFGPIQRGGGIVVLGDGPVTIGGTGPSQNIIAFNYDGFYTTGVDRKTILENSFYCNSNKGIHLEGNANNGILPPAILCLQGNNLVGSAEPGSLVYLYRHDDIGCPGVECQGKAFVDRVMTDAGGTWIYDISAWPGARFTAIQEDSDGNSSEFAECILDPNLMAYNTGPYCPGDSIFLFAEVDSSITNATFEWFGPNGYTSNQQNPINAWQPGQYLVVANVMGCGADSAYTDVVVYPISSDTITEVCIGDSVIVNGVVYNEMNPFGIDTIPNADPNGCDSIIVIALQYRPTVEGKIYSTRPRACSGDSVAYWFELQFGDGPYDVIYTTGAGQPDTVFGIFDGYFDTIVVSSDVHFEILDIIEAGNNCPPLIRQSDSIMVSELAISPIVTDYGGFGVSCFGENDGMITLNAMGGVGSLNYDWNLNALDGNDIATQLSAGTYSVTVTDGANCRAEFDTLITQPNAFEAIVFIDPTTCAGVNDGAIVVDAILGGRGTVGYSLDGGPATPVGTLPLVLGNLPVGLHNLLLTDSAGCVQDLDLSIPLGETPFVDLGPEQSIFSGDSVLLSYVTELEPIDINWSPFSVVSCQNCPTTYAFPPLDQYVTVTLTDSAGCVAIDSVLIRVFVPKQVYIPTVFSPNEDNINDRFYIQANTFADMVEYLIVVDRWGDVVYEVNNVPVNDPDFGWDGTLNGREMFPAVYTYLTRVRFTDGEVLPFSGTVTLIR